MSSGAGNRYYGLDAMRGLAAITVVVYHLNLLAPQARGLGASGYLAVDFFFLLSGFVIAHAYEERLKEGLGWAAFARLRLIRLYPLFLLGVALACVKPLVQMAAQQPGALDAATLASWAGANALMLPAPNSTALFPMNPPAWSLFLEVLINLVFAAFMVGARKRWLAAVVLLSGAALVWLAVQGGTLDIGWGWEGAHVGVVRVIFSFTAGVLAWRLGAGRVRTESWLALAPLAALLAMMWLPLPAAWRGAVNGLTVVLLFPLLLVAAARYEAPARLRSLCALSGDVSYPLYAVHYPLLLAYMAGVQNLKGWSAVLAVVAFVPVCVVLARMALRIYDAPVRARLARILRFPAGSGARPQAPAAPGLQ